MAQSNHYENSPLLGGGSVSLRRDLQFATIQRGLQVTQVIKDPVNLKYYEFEEHEMAVLQRLNHKMSRDELCQWFNRRYPPLRLTPQALSDLIWRLYQQGLLVTNTVGQGQRMADQTRQLWRREWMQRISQPWAIRLPGINPGPWLRPINQFFGWIFSPQFVGCAGLFLMLLLALAFTQHRAILRMTPATIEFFSRENIWLFAIVVVITKIMHEMGHAIAAFRQGCECHELGILLLAGFPSLYCDVSDVWMVSSRWRRISVSLAGIWIEILIAAIALITWSASVPGVVHAISFNVMVVCSLGTVLFNANPLVRYDGYYVLMDLVGISNLGERSHEAITQFFLRWGLGSTQSPPLDTPEVPRWCLMYGFLAALYRLFLSIAIVWGIHLALKPFSLSFMVWILAAVGIFCWGFRMCQTSSHRIRTLVAMGTPAWWMWGRGLTMVSLLIVSLFLPLPWFVFGDALLEPEDRQTLVTAVAGQLVERRDVGDLIEVGEPIARFVNPEIQREVERIEAESRVVAHHVQSLRARRNQDQRAAEQIPGAEATLAALEHRLRYRIDELDRLELRANKKSVIYPAPLRLRSGDDRELPFWNGTLLDSSNQTAVVSPGDVFCQTGTLDQLEAIATLAEDDLEAVAVGQTVDLYLKSSGKIVRGEILRISHRELTPDEDAYFGSPSSVSNDIPGRKKRDQKRYQAQIRCLSPVPHGTRVRSSSRVRIHVGRRSLGGWIAIQFFKTFRWSY
jgi:putative peptide zinc metalloprotease protein